MAIRQFTSLFLRPLAGGPVQAYTATCVGEDTRGILATIPRLSGAPVRPAPGTELRVWYEEEGQRAEFVTWVRGYVPGPPPLVVLAPPKYEVLADARRSPRVAVRWPVRLAAGALRDQAGFTRDVSLTGVRLDTPAWLEAGTQVMLTLTLPTGAPCTAQGRVVWARWEGACVAGIAFTEMAPAHRVALARALALVGRTPG